MLSRYTTFIAFYPFPQDFSEKIGDLNFTVNNLKMQSYYHICFFQKNNLNTTGSKVTSDEEPFHCCEDGYNTVKGNPG